MIAWSSCRVSSFNSFGFVFNVNVNVNVNANINVNVLFTIEFANKFTKYLGWK